VRWIRGDGRVQRRAIAAPPVHVHLVAPQTRSALTGVEAKNDDGGSSCTLRLRPAPPPSPLMAMDSSAVTTRRRTPAPTRRKRRIEGIRRQEFEEEQVCILLFHNSFSSTQAGFIYQPPTNTVQAQKNSTTWPTGPDFTAHHNNNSRSVSTGPPVIPVNLRRSGL
jgi:hypothetical protein